MALLILALLLTLLQSQAQKPSTPAQSETPLAQSVDTAWSVLHDGYTDKSADRRAHATRALGLLKHEAKAQAMAEKALADDTSANVRVQAAVALGDMDAMSAQPNLLEALKDNDLKVVVAAANSLYKFKNPAAYDIYYALLTGERKGPGLVKSQLDTLRDKKQLEELALETGIGFIPFGGMGLEAYKRITSDDNELVIELATEKLATDPDPKTGQALENACASGKWAIRLAAVEALAKRGDGSLGYSVVPLMYDSKEEVRYAAAATVIRLSRAPLKKPAVHKVPRTGTHQR